MVWPVLSMLPTSRHIYSCRVSCTIPCVVPSRSVVGGKKVIVGSGLGATGTRCVGLVLKEVVRSPSYKKDRVGGGDGAITNVWRKNKWHGTGGSHVVLHRSTSPARRRVTSQSGRDVVRSAWYGRSCQCWEHQDLYTRAEYPLRYRASSALEA